MTATYTYDELWNAIEFVYPSLKDARINGVNLHLLSSLNAAIIKAAHNEWKHDPFPKWVEDILHKAYDDINVTGAFAFQEFSVPNGDSEDADEYEE